MQQFFIGFIVQLPFLVALSQNRLNVGSHMTLMALKESPVEEIVVLESEI